MNGEHPDKQALPTKETSGSMTTMPAARGLALQCYHEGCQLTVLMEQNKLLHERLERTSKRAWELQVELSKVIEHLREFQR